MRRPFAGFFVDFLGFFAGFVDFLQSCGRGEGGRGG
jgi:hypothetical protein